jgi:glycosyltransferase involved in cell wall biosynthesis
LLDRVLAVHLPGWCKEVILVEDGSTDGTQDELRRFAGTLPAGGPLPDAVVRVVFLEKNRGKGAALRAGFAQATGDVVVVQDADLEYDPADFPKVLAPFDDPQTMVVYGSRFLVPQSQPGPLKTVLANKFLTFLSNRATGQRITDMETCYKAFRREVIQALPLEQERFGFEPEVTARVAQRGLTICEVPITYHARSRKEGKKIGWKDGLRAIQCILKYRVKRK